MAYVFEAREALNAGIRRIAAEEVQAALEALHGSGDPDERIHEVRKSLKKLRALLRLARRELGEATFSRENGCFRDLGRRLSAARDRAARRESFAKLLGDFGLNPEEFADVSRFLAEHRASNDPLGLDDTLSRDVDQGLRLALARISGWPLARSSWKAIARGLRRTYARGQRAFDVAYTDPTADHFHEWRKRTKDHLYHARLLSSIWREPMKGWRAAVEDLAEALGDDHDLAELSLALAAQNELDPKQLDVVTGFIEERARQLRERARFLGERIYAEKPGRLVARLRAYYEAWQKEGALPEPAPGDAPEPPIT
jgi:CHAD domain-containing protein